MERAVAELSADELDVKLLDDEYATQLLALAQLKREARQDVVEIEEAPVEDEEGGADVIDIMSVLRERMGAARGPARARPAPAMERAASRMENDDGLADKSKKDLYERAKKLGVPGRSSMSREQLVAALRKAG
jgi:DNA end-binding protein Ku